MHAKKIIGCLGSCFHAGFKKACGLGGKVASRLSHLKERIKSQIRKGVK